MTNLTFYQNVDILKNKIYNTKMDNLNKNSWLWSYLTVSSNLSTFFSNFKEEDHYKMILDMYFHRALSEIDLLYPSLIENTVVYDESNTIESSRKKSHIYISYHTGGYNMSLRYLANKNIPFCVVANDDYIKKNKINAQKLYGDVPNKKEDKLEILPAEDPKLLLKLVKKLKEGISVYIFIDGNSGSLKNRFENDKNLLKINFLDHHIYARQGVAYLAYLSKAPIATILAERDENLNTKVTVNRLKVESLYEKYNRNDFINHVTKKVYERLEVHLKDNYRQWSGWFYLHNFFDTERLQEDCPFDKRNLNYSQSNYFKLNDFMQLVKYSDDHLFLVIKRKYQVMKIKKNLFDVLSYFKSPQKINLTKTLSINNNSFNSEFIKELIELNYLKPV